MITGIGLVLAVAGWGAIDETPTVEALPAHADASHIVWSQASDHIGEECFVYGKVVLAATTAQWCFLNFHEDYRNHFSVLIARRNFERFESPPDGPYRNKIVRVFGRIEEYRAKAEIKVTSPEQITVLDVMPTAEELAQRNHREAVTTRTPRAPGVVILATYNVENLFDAADDPYHRDEHTKPKSREALEKLAATLRNIDADVVALQEVENRGYLERFVKQLLPDAGYTEIVHLEGNDQRGIDVALLSRLPVGPVTSYRHLEFEDSKGARQRFRRDLLRVRLEPDTGPSFDVFVVHFKSKRGGENDVSHTVRVAEARATRQVLDEVLRADPDARFVLCGDFNDTAESESIKTIMGQGAGALRCFSDDLPADNAATYRRPPYRSMIDFIFCSPGMAVHYRPGTYSIPLISDSASGSDHNPVVVVFDMQRTPQATPPAPEE